MKIELEAVVDEIKSNWFEWSCTVTMPDGRRIEGTVQADASGDMIATESFVAD